MPTQCHPHHLLVKKKISSLKASHIGNMVFFLYIYVHFDGKKTFTKTNCILIYLIHNYFNNLIWPDWLDMSKNNLDDSQSIQY
jgi:hypothetical protein